MKYLALIDATHHTEAAPPGRVVAGLSLLERAVRLAAINDCSHAVVVAPPDDKAHIEQLVADIEEDIELVICASDADNVGALVADVAPTVEPLVEVCDGVIYLRSSTVYDRGLVGDVCEPATPEGGNAGAALPDLFACATTVWAELVDVCRRETPADVAGIAEAIGANTVDSDGWQVRVEDEASANRAAQKLWDSCRKDQDGIVSRHLNRHISLAISRLLAPTAIHPNHISVATFSLGVLAAVFAAVGGFWWFVLAGVTYQINSVIDGVDGELARVKYEFSVLGEWLDTVSDDTKDVLFYAGLGVGAHQTFDFPLEAGGADTWLWLAGVAVTGKLCSMIAYYTWLAARGRGDLLAFEWEFEDEDAEPGPIASTLSKLKYLTKNDFIVFFAMILGFVGALPFLLFVVAPGQMFIAASVVVQRLRH